MYKLTDPTKPAPEIYEMILEEQHIIYYESGAYLEPDSVESAFHDRAAHIVIDTLEEAHNINLDEYRPEEEEIA